MRSRQALLLTAPLFLALASTSGTAHADSGVAVSPGVMLSLSLGDRPAFGLGVDLRGGAVVNDRLGLGLFAQATWLNFQAARYAGGLQGGYVFDAASTTVGPLFEAGLSYRTALGDSPAFGAVHVGTGAAVVWGLFQFVVRGTFPWEARHPEITLSVEGHLPPPYMRFDSFFDFGSGRPVRDERGRAVLPRARPAHRRRAPPSRAADRAVARAWLDDAKMECSSVGAFVRLASELESLEAPRDLVVRARRAARDELRHTALCLERVSALGGTDYGMELPPAPAPRALDSAPLTRVALEALHEGCLGEGTAAAIARHAGGVTNAAIAVDEAEHAELSWDVLAWCMAQGGRDVRRAVRDVTAVLEPVAFRAPTDDAAALRRGERLGAVSMLRVAHATRASVARRVDEMSARSMGAGS